MALLSVAYEQAATLLNDPSQTEWSDAVLLSRAKKAHVELQVRLYEFGVPVIKEVTTAISVPASTSVLPSQPADLLEPLFMKEKGSTEPDTKYINMNEVNFIPPAETPTTEIRFWAWREEVVQLMKATVARLVQLRYLKGLTAVTSGASQIGVIFGEAFLGPRIAALCYQSVGQLEDASINNADAESQLDRILRASIRGTSHRPVRRIPFSVAQEIRRRRSLVY